MRQVIHIQWPVSSLAIKIILISLNEFRKKHGKFPEVIFLSNTFLNIIPTIAMIRRHKTLSKSLESIISKWFFNKF